MKSVFGQWAGHRAGQTHRRAVPPDHPHGRLVLPLPGSVGQGPLQCGLVGREVVHGADLFFKPAFGGLEQGEFLV